MQMEKDRYCTKCKRIFRVSVFAPDAFRCPYCGHVVTPLEDSICQQFGILGIMLCTKKGCGCLLIVILLFFLYFAFKGCSSGSDRNMPDQQPVAGVSDVRGQAGVENGAQRLGAQAGRRSPDGGEADEKWIDSVGQFVDMLWEPPGNTFGGGDPPWAVLELVIASDGRVLRARLAKPSGNARMDGSIRQLIRQLEGRYAPRPPQGERTIEVELTIDR